jgi:hypothetical protein
MRITHTLACGLLIAIFFVVIQSPSREQTNASARNSIEGLLDRLAKNDEAMMTLITQHGQELASIEDCHIADSEVVRTQLVSLQEKVEKSVEVPTESVCDCNCEIELAKLKKQVESLEALCKPQVKSNYPSVSSSGSGSTGTVVSSLGSTGSRVAMPVQQSYGSTGSATGNVVSTPLRTPLRTVAAVVAAPIARAGHWSYPGEISNHLAVGHNVNASGMTREQMLNLHDSLHESAPVQAPVRVQNNCPGGVCPTGPSVQRVQSNGWFLGKNLGRQR